MWEGMDREVASREGGAESGGMSRGVRIGKGWIGRWRGGREMRRQEG